MLSEHTENVISANSEMNMDLNYEISVIIDKKTWNR